MKTVSLIVLALIVCGEAFAASSPTVRVTGKVVVARGEKFDVQLFIDQGNGDPIALWCPERLALWCWRLKPGTPIAADVVITGTAGQNWNGDYELLGTVTVLEGVRIWKTGGVK